MEPQKQNGRTVRTYGRGRSKHNKAQLPTDYVQTQQRMTHAMRTRLEEAAAHNGRSMNAEINARLERSFWLDDMLKARLISVRVPAERGG
jgi:hypothetical protein